MERPIFISDASAEAERLTAALRAYGYVVTDVPLSLLAGRAAREQPRMVVCDVDAEGIQQVVAQLQAIESSPSLAMVFIGAAGGLVDSDFAQRARATFVRPVDAQQLLECIERLVGPPPDRRMSAPPPSVRPPPLVGRLPPTLSSPPTSSDSDPVQRETPASTPPFPPEVDFADAPPRPAVPHAELSAEIAALLREAERRVEELEPMPGAARELPSPEEEIDVELPPDVLSALEEPIDEEDEPGSGAEPLSESPPEGTNLTTSAGGMSRETSASGETSAKRHPPVEAGTFVTESGARGRTGSRALTSLDEQPAGAAAPEQPEPEQERRARQEAATPKPPRPPTRPPVTMQTSPPVFSEKLPAAPALPVVSAAPAMTSHPDASDASEPPSGYAGPTTEPSTAPPPRVLPRTETKTAAPPRVAQASMSAIETEGPRAEAPSEPIVPKTLREGDAVRALAAAIRSRFSGALVLEVDQGIRRIVFREGDFITAASGIHGESLVAFLVGKGDLPADVTREAHKLPMFGRHAGAALIAQGYLAQDQLWTVLRAHAEWIVSNTVQIDRGSAALEWELPGRLREEPAVFGGATGAEVLVEIVRRVITPEVAASRLGGWNAELSRGPAQSLLSECALPTSENELVLQSAGTTLRAVSARAEDPSFTAALYALSELGVLGTTRPEPAAGADSEEPAYDELDEAALRARVAARKALVEEGDYFAVLGVGRRATGYDIRRAYTALRREFDPSQIITAATADLRDDVDQILEVLQEAYDILKDQHRRERYRRAIEATPN